MRAVRAITGMDPACGILELRSSSRTAKPSVSGIWISVRSTSYPFSLSLATSSLLSVQQSHVGVVTAQHLLYDTELADIIIQYKDTHAVQPSPETGTGFLHRGCPVSWCKG